MTSTFVFPASHFTGVTATSGPSPLPPSLGPDSGVPRTSTFALGFVAAAPSFAGSMLAVIATVQGVTMLPLVSSVIFFRVPFFFKLIAK